MRFEFYLRLILTLFFCLILLLTVTIACIIIFYRFPMNDQSKLELWVKAVGRKGFIPNKNSRLCHEHFKTSDFYENPGGSYKLYFVVII